MPDHRTGNAAPPFFAPPQSQKDILLRLRPRFPAWPLSSEHPWFPLFAAGTLLENAEDDPAFPALAGAMLFTSWQNRPLDGKTAAFLAHADDRLRFLPAPVRALVKAIDALPEAEPFEGDDKALADYLSADAPGSISRLAAAWECLLGMEDADCGRALLASSLKNAPASLVARLTAEFEFHRGEPDEAMTRLDSLDFDAWGLFSTWLRCRLLTNGGAAEEAAATLAPLWRAMPWRTNVALVLHSLIDPIPLARNIGQNEAIVLLYAFNKVDMVGETLANLAKTRLGPSRILLLDNGSTDGTGEILERSARLFPEGACQVVRLPVNIGAPAARNWLLSHPLTKASRYAAFLDDDAFPPKQWLEELLGAARKNPHAGAIGCRIKDLAPPHRLQTADANLLPEFMGTRSLPGVAERIFVFDACHKCMRYGHYAYSRPCLSVSGCCHLVNMRAVAETGPFDIRFSPTQFDDLDRDMRSWLGGFPAFYHGRLKVRHHRSRSISKTVSALMEANIFGNKAKLEYNFTPEELDRLWRENTQTLWDDLLAKTDVLWNLYE